MAILFVHDSCQGNPIGTNDFFNQRISTDLIFVALDFPQKTTIDLNMVHISIHRSILYQVIQSHLKLGCFISPFQGVFRDLQGRIFPTELQLLPDTKISKSKALRELNSTQTSTERGLQRWEQAGIFVGEIYRKSNMDNEMRCDWWHHWGCPRYYYGFLSWIWQTE